MPKYKVEYAKNKASKCQGCQLTIEKGEIRTGTLLPDGRMKNYFHARCMSKGALLADFEGLDALSTKDEAQVRMWILEDNMAAQTRKRAEAEQTVSKKKSTPRKKQKKTGNPFTSPPDSPPYAHTAHTFPHSHTSHTFPHTFPHTSPNYNTHTTPPQSPQSPNPKGPNTPKRTPSEIYKTELSDLVNEATQIYKTADDFTNTLESRYQTCLKAFRLYSEAHDMATEPDFRIGVRRNMGMVAYKAAALAIQKRDLDRAVYHMQASIHHLSSAVEEGARISTRSRDWQQTIEDKIISGLDLISYNTDAKSSPDRVAALLQIGSHMTSFRLLHAELNYKIATIIFNEAVSLQDSGQWSRSKGTLGSVVMYLSEALRLCNSSDAKEDAEILNSYIEDLENRKRIHLCIAESRILRLQADEDFQKQVFVEECIDINHIWHTLDNYQQAAILTRELDNESEAIALSRIGKIYAKFFKIKEKAHSYFRRTLDLAFSLQPRDLSSFEWFREAQEFLTKFQNEQLLDEQKRRDEWKQPFLIKLKEKLDLIKAANKSALELLVYVYKNHPPGNRALPTDESIGKKLVHAIVHFYAEENSNSNSEEQQVLYGEIAKMLNARHQTIKDV